MDMVFAFVNNIMLFAADSAPEMTTGQRILLIVGIILGVCVAVVILSLLVILIKAMIQAGINLKKQGNEAQNAQNTDFYGENSAITDENASSDVDVDGDNKGV